MRSLLPARRMAVASALALLVTACGTSGASTTSATSDTTTSAASPTASANASASASTSADVVDVNTASVDEIVAALEAAGVTNAERWADEVTEYRPYPTDDPQLGKLRQKLAKYNPGEDTLDRILSALTV